MVKSQDSTIRTIVLINGEPFLVDVLPNGDITAQYQKVDNYFSSSESHDNILARETKKDSQPSSSLVFFENEEEPVVPFTEENLAPILPGNEQYIGFSPGKAILQKAAVDQIRKISKEQRGGLFRLIGIRSYNRNNFRSRALSRNRAKAIKDLLIAFGVPENQIASQTLEGTSETKVDFVQVSFGG